MSRMLLMVALMVLALATGCSSVSLVSQGQTGTQAITETEAASARAATPKQSADLITAHDGAGNVVIQKVKLRPGVSSSTVERLAKQVGCSGSAGAGLITEKGPVEVYRMQCDNGTAFLARCELRQCKPMQSMR